MTTGTLVTAMQEADEDFEWYPTTDRMIAEVKYRLPDQFDSLMDIGAGDGRVLVQLATGCSWRPKLFAIEKSTVLISAQPQEIIPVGTDFYEQNLACLPCDFIFCNPPYSRFEDWACSIIRSGYAKRAYLVIPQRWTDSVPIAGALKARGATAEVIHSDHFADADRRARAVVDVIEISYPKEWRDYDAKAQDPFDIWFEQNISTFDQETTEPIREDPAAELARTAKLDSIDGLVEAFDAEYLLMEQNYRAIFQLDYAILKELNVSKENVRDGIKQRMAGLKTKYWRLLFDRLKSITDRLATKTREQFLKHLTERHAIAFTCSNAYAVVIWALKNANQYYNTQLVELFRAVSTFEGVLNYKSNQRTWSRENWRYMTSPDDSDKPTHYALDYRIVVSRYNAIRSTDRYQYDFQGNLHRGCHELIADIVAVMGNLGYSTAAAPDPKKPSAGPTCLPSQDRTWIGGQWQDFNAIDGSVLFQVKGYQNGNLHLRFKPQAIMALNVEAGRLLGWLKSPADVVTEMGLTEAEARTYFKSSLQFAPGQARRLLCA